MFGELAPGRLAGGSRYTAQINVKNKRPEIVVESALQGVALDFPAPLKKAAGDAMPLRFELSAAPSVQAGELRDELRLALGRAIVRDGELRSVGEEGLAQDLERASRRLAGALETTP